MRENSKRELKSDSLDENNECEKPIENLSRDLFFSYSLEVASKLTTFVNNLFPP